MNIRLFPEILLNILRIIANLGRYSKLRAFKLGDIMSGSIAFENILSIRVLEWVVILVGCKIKGIKKLEKKESNNLSH